MAMMDMSMDEAKVKMWIMDVNSELDAVRLILDKVNATNASIPGDDDTIMHGIYNVGTMMESSWRRMCNSFTEAQGKIQEAVNGIINSVNSALDDVETMKGKASSN